MMRKMVVVAISGVWLLVGWKTVGKMGRIAMGVEPSRAAIVASGVVMGGLKVKISMKVIYLGG